MSPTVPVFTGEIPTPYPHYTTCVEAADFHPEPVYVQMAFAGIFTGVIAFAVAAVNTVAPWCYVAAAEVTVIATGLVYCNWWLTDRLICLPADLSASSGPAVDVCAVGMFVQQDQTDPSVIPFDVPDLDTDWTMDIVLYGTEPSDPAVDVLIGETEAIENLGLGFRNDGRGSTDDYVLSGTYDGSTEAYMNGGVTVTSPVLHCEVEGAGVADYRDWLQGAFAVAVAALVAQIAVAVIPGIGPFLSAALAALAVLAFLLGLGGFYASETDHPDQPAGPGGQSLTFTTPGQQSGAPASVVCVIGTWVYDSAHDGWNEIHPVKSIQSIGTLAPSLSGYPWNPAWAAQCEMMNQASGLPTRTAQTEASNQWIIHPAIDGCGTYPTAPANPPPPIH